MSLRSWLEAIPKVELHVHLEGSIPYPTLIELARRNRVALPADDPASLERALAFRDFDGFVRALMAAASCLRTADDYETAVRALAASLARARVRYAEVTTTPSLARFLGVPDGAYLEGLARGRAAARAEHGVELAWVLDIVRCIAEEPRRTEYADHTTALAIDGREAGVVALGLGGVEAGFPARPFRPWFERARAAGVHAAPHAGEHAGPESVWEALRELGAERIGHGIAAARDPELVRHLAREGVALEVCPTSNVRTGAVADLAAHPLRALVDAGVAVTVNSDDPALFGTTLSAEYALLAGPPFGLAPAAIAGIAAGAARASFLAPERRAALAGEIEAEAAALAREHLGA